jgi:hypothetical protein
VAQYLRVSTGRQAASDGKRHLFGRDRLARILHALIERHGAKNQPLKERWSALELHAPPASSGQVQQGVSGADSGMPGACGRLTANDWRYTPD